MSVLYPIAVALHALSAVIWVGGMFFAHQVLRPYVSTMEPPPERPKLWSKVLAKFFIWVWKAVVLLPATGYFLIFSVYGGFAGAGLYVHIMNGIGTVMIVIFIYLFFGPYKRFKAAAEAEDWPAAGALIPTIRRIVGTNLILGLITVAVGASGRYWM